MSKLVGIVVTIAGVIASIYFGIVVLFVGGIQQIVDAVQAHHVSGAEVAWGVFRVLVASTGAGLGIWLSVGLGLVIAALGDD